MTKTHPYASFVHRVKKPAQYLGGEPGEVQKDWSTIRASICLAFPDLYEIGMSHLGYKILYKVINEHPELAAERAYAAWHDMEKELREREEPLRSLETWKPLSEFDIVGFSLQYELTYTNILSMLELGGVPLRSKDRGNDDPLVVAGGPVATHAEPIAPFVDVFLIGDGEAKTPELMLAWADLRDAGLPRHERLKAIAQLGGFYVPALYERELDEDINQLVVKAPEDPDIPFPVVRSFLPDFRDYPFPTDGPVAATETIFDRVSVEIARGCTEGCRFCQAGMIYRPVRERTPEEIITAITQSVKKNGYEEASLTSLSTADYSAIQPLVSRVMKELEGQRVNVSVSSLRAYGLSENVLDDMKTQRAGGLTFAPEAGTQRMRDVVNKNVTEEQLMETAERVFSRGWKKMKLYFMIGLPTEEDEDVRGIVDTGNKARAVARRVRGRNDGRVVVSVSTHVPKPHTPFQWCEMNSYDEILRKQEILREHAKELRVTLRMHDSKGSWLEGILARGDVRLADVIEDAFRGGARFDSWDEQLNHDAWDAALKDHNVDTQTILGTRPVTARLPWSHIDVGLEEGFLAREYRKALRNRLSPPCGKVAGAFVHETNLKEARAQKKRLVCYDCGVACDLTEMRSERIEYLSWLGAEEAPAPKERSSDEKIRLQIAKKELERLPMQDVDQGPALRIRLAFSKLGRLAYSSHLDLVRLMPRLFRKAELPLFYSEGYHPKPQLVFSPALALGIASLREILDFKVRERDFDPADLPMFVERLREMAFDGLEIHDAAILGHHDRSVNKLIDEATWVVGLPPEFVAELGGAEKIQELVESRRGGELKIMRTTPKRGTREIDVSDALSFVDFGKGDNALKSAGLPGDLLPIRFGTWQRNEGTAKPSEVLMSLLELSDSPDVWWVREALWARKDGERIDLLDLEPVRRKPTPKTTAQVSV